MPLKVFIGYGSASDQVTALRLQALGAVNGITVHVPPAYTRQEDSGAIDSNSQANLDSSDVVLGLAVTHLFGASRRELDWASQSGKQTILLVDSEIAPEMTRNFPGSVFLINPHDPGGTEYAIVEFLMQTNLDAKDQQSLIVLRTLALGLLLFAPHSLSSDKKDWRDRHVMRHRTRPGPSCSRNLRFCSIGCFSRKR